MAEKKRKYGIELVLKGKSLLGAAFSRAKKTLDGIGKVARGIGKLGGLLSAPVGWVAKLGKGIGGLIEKVPGIMMLGQAFGWAGGQLKQMVVDVSELGGRLTDLSAQTGFTTTQLQEMGFVAEKLGIPIEQFDASMRKMVATLGRGVNGSQLRMLGKDASGFARALRSTKDPAARFELVFAQLAKIEDPAKRAAFAVQFFGEAGVKLGAAGTAGADGIREMRQEAHRLAGVMTDEEVKRADEFGDTWESVGMVAKGVRRDFASGLVQGLLPALQDLLGYTKENRKAVGELVKDLGRKVGTGIVDAARWTINAVKWIVDNKGTIIEVAEKVGIALAALAGMKLIGAAGSLLGGVAGMLGGGAGATGGGAGLLGGLLGGWKLGLVALAGGVVYMMGKAIGQMLPRKLTPEEVQINKLAGGQIAGRADRLQVATLGGATPWLTMTPNKAGADELTKRQKDEALRYQNGPIDLRKGSDAFVNADDRARYERYLDAAGYKRTYEGLDAINAAERQMKMEIDVKVSGGTADVDVKTTKLPPDMEAKIAKFQANTGRRSQDFSKGGQ